MSRSDDLEYPQIERVCSTNFDMLSCIMNERVYYNNQSLTTTKIRDTGVALLQFRNRWHG